MDKIIQALRLEAEALYHTHLKSIIITLGLVTLGLVFFIASPHQNSEELGINYNIDIEREYSESSQKFFATNNEVEKIYGDILSRNQENFGEAIAFANTNTIAVSSIDKEDGLMIVHILKKSGNQWQEIYSFSYNELSTTNYQIPNSEIPEDSDDLMFGASLAFYKNNTLAIGAPSWQGPSIIDNINTPDIYEADDGIDRGSVYIFKKTNATWSLSNTIRGFDAKSHFGSAVDFSPSGILVIGAAGDTVNEGCPIGYIDEVTVPAGEDTDDDGDIDSDDTHEIRNKTNPCPAVHLYNEDSNSQWSKINTISSESSIIAGAGFGRSVAFANDNLLAVGAPYQYAPRVINNEGYKRRPGAVHLYSKNNDSEWIQTLVFSDFNSSNPGTGKYQLEIENLAYFGQSVSFIDANTLAVGSNNESDGTGSVYIFQSSNDVWSQILRISDDDPATRYPLGFKNRFGYAIDVQGNTLAITNIHDTKNAEAIGSEGVVNLLNWTTFKPGAIWHYTYIDDNNCGSNDFLNSPTAYTEGEVITPPSSANGKRLCFKADSGSNRIEYFASDIIDTSSPQFADPALTITEDDVLSIYFTEKVRQLNNEEIDEGWVDANVGNLSITLHNENTPLTIALNSDAGKNSGNSLVSVEHISDRTVLRVLIDTDNSNFPPTTAPTISAPHVYEISLMNFEDFFDNPQLTALTARQEITGYSGAVPIITINTGENQTIDATDSLATGESRLSYVWLAGDATCDSMTGFASATTYTEGDDIRLKETHNGQKICFKSTNVDDSSLVGYKALLIEGIDWTAPIISIVMTETSITATDDDTETTTWQYVILDENSCEQTMDFSLATTYTEGDDITVDVNSDTQFNKYYCFKVADNTNNAHYKSSSQIGGSPVIEKITVGGPSNSKDLFGIGVELIVNMHFSESITLTGSQRSMYVHVNSQATANNLNAYRDKSSYLSDGILSFYYITQIDDYTDNLQILEIILANGAAIQDADGNDAILDLEGLNIVRDATEEPRTIKVDGHKPTITLVQSNMDAWSATKTISATDNEDDNDTYWDYYFFNTSNIANSTFAPAEIGCYLGDYLPSGIMEGTPYVEGTVITLEEERNDYYICFRSRRSQKELWNLGQERDRAGAISELIQKIDTTLPVVVLNNQNGQITAAATDLGGSGLKPDSLIYKIVNAAEDCTENTFDTGTTIYEGPIEITSTEEGKYFCFRVEDLVDNKGYANTVASKRPVNQHRRSDTRPPNIEVTNPDTEPATHKVVSAITNSSDVEDSSWKWKVYDSNTETCDAKLIAYNANPYTAAEEIILDNEMYNGQSVCFSVSDSDGNTAYASSDVINGIDKTAPSIIIMIDNDELTAIDDDEDETYWRYKIIEESIDCNLEALENAQTYIEGSILSLVNHENYKVCFEIKDSLDNTNYQDSATFAVIQDISTLNLDVSVNDEDEEDNATPTSSPQPVEEEEEIEEEQSEQQQTTPTTGENTGDQNDNSVSFWLILLGLLLLIIVFFFTKRRRDEDN